MAHPKLLLERAGALATITSDLHHMIMHLREAEYYNRAHALGLTLPRVADLKEIIDQCARIHKSQIIEVDDRANTNCGADRP
jgi:hypothetical protein